MGACIRYHDRVYSLTFADLNIDQDMVDALATKGIIEPFPIQTQTIPMGLNKQDIIGQAKTGTGKTLGFGLPLLQSLGTDPAPGVKALVVVPTRELCVQVAEDLTMASSNRGTKVVAIYGGKAYEGQVEQLKDGAQVVVGQQGGVKQQLRVFCGLAHALGAGLQAFGFVVEQKGCGFRAGLCHGLKACAALVDSVNASHQGNLA